MVFENCVIEAQVPGCRWVLFRRKGQGQYFYIADMEGLYEFIPMLELYGFSHNYFKCRSLAVAMYRVFASAVIREIAGQGAGVRSPAPMNNFGGNSE